MVTQGATGKSLISLKNNPILQKYALFIQPLLSQVISLFFPFSKSKQFPKTVQFLLIVYKIFHFNIQLTATIEHKPKTNMQRQVELGFLKLKGFALWSLASRVFNPKDIICKSINRCHYSKSFYTGQTGFMLDIPDQPGTLRFCQDLFSPSGMNYTDANAFDLQNKTDWTASPSHLLMKPMELKYTWPFSIQEPLANQEVRCWD